MQSLKEEWINERMKKLLAEDFCPRCSKHKTLHDDTACGMRWEKEEETING